MNDDVKVLVSVYKKGYGLAKIAIFIKHGLDLELKYFREPDQNETICRYLPDEFKDSEIVAVEEIQGITGHLELS